MLPSSQTTKQRRLSTSVSTAMPRLAFCFTHFTEACHVPGKEFSAILLFGYFSLSTISFTPSFETTAGTQWRCCCSLHPPQLEFGFLMAATSTSSIHTWWWIIVLLWLHFVVGICPASSTCKIKIFTRPWSSRFAFHCWWTRPCWPRRVWGAVQYSLGLLTGPWGWCRHPAGANTTGHFNRGVVLSAQVCHIRPGRRWAMLIPSLVLSMAAGDAANANHSALWLSPAVWASRQRRLR